MKIQSVIIFRLVFRLHLANVAPHPYGPAKDGTAYIPAIIGSDGIGFGIELPGVVVGEHDIAAAVAVDGCRAPDDCLAARSAHEIDMPCIDVMDGPVDEYERSGRDCRVHEVVFHLDDDEVVTPGDGIERAFDGAEALDVVRRYEALFKSVRVSDDRNGEVVRFIVAAVTVGRNNLISEAIRYLG